MSVSSDGQIVTGDTDSILNVWEDTTKEEEKENLEKKQEEQQILQDFQKMIREKEYGPAVRLCLRSDQPRRMFYALKMLYKEKDDEHIVTTGRDR
jgi:hypothetical protein